MKTDGLPHKKYYFYFSGVSPGQQDSPGIPERQAQRLQALPDRQK
jgi:hypothetical protein